MKTHNTLKAIAVLNDMKRLSQILAIAAVVISLSGCKGTHEVVREVPVYLHDTVHEQSVQKDSVYVHDSVYVYQTGDTLYISREHTKYIEREVHDTIREVQETPVEVARTEVQEIEKPLRWYQKALQFLGCLVVVACLGAGLGFLLSWYVNARILHK